MNQLLVFITVLVAFVYFGGSNVPKVLKDNKQMLLGFVGGIVLYSSMGMRVEGVVSGPEARRTHPGLQAPDSPLRLDPHNPPTVQPIAHLQVDPCWQGGKWVC